jgi:type IV pilus assembly protein PilF
MSSLLTHLVPACLATLLLALSGCITTVEGGFTEKASPKAALESRVSLARRYIGERNWDDAKRNLELAQNIDPSNAEVYEAFGLMYQATGETELAEKSFKKSIRLDRNCSRCRNNYAAFLYSNGLYEEAEAEMEIVAKDTLYSARPQALTNLGLTRLKLGDTYGATEAFELVLSMDRRNPFALLELSQLRFEAGDIEGARDYYNDYRSVVRQQSAKALWLGIRLAQQAQDSDAEASYALALSNRFPDSPEYQVYLRTQQGD